jgi:hypothetical protein
MEEIVLGISISVRLRKENKGWLTGTAGTS